MDTLQTDRFLIGLRALGFRPSSCRTAEAFGISVRQMQRIVAGKAPVPRTMALLMIMYLAYEVLPEQSIKAYEALHDVEIL